MQTYRKSHWSYTVQQCCIMRSDRTPLCPQDVQILSDRDCLIGFWWCDFYRHVCRTSSFPFTLFVIDTERRGTWGGKQTNPYNFPDPHHFLPGWGSPTIAPLKHWHTATVGGKTTSLANNNTRASGSIIKWHGMQQIGFMMNRTPSIHISVQNSPNRRSNGRKTIAQE